MDNEKKEFETEENGFEGLNEELCKETENSAFDETEGVLDEPAEVLNESENVFDKTGDFEEEQQGEPCRCEETEENTDFSEECGCGCGCGCAAENEGGEYTLEDGEENGYEKKSSKKTLFAVLAVIVVLIGAALVYSVCVQNGVGTKSIVNTKLSSEGEDGEKEESKLNVKFENPFITMFEKGATGKETALKVGNYSVSKGVFEYFLKNSALNYEYGLYMKKDITDLDKFNWQDTDKDSGLSYSETVKGKTVETLAPIVSLISVATEKGVALTEEEIKSADDNVEQIKSSYKDNLDEVLKQNGFDSIETYKEMVLLQSLYGKAYADFSENPSEYMKGFKNYRASLSEDMITVKHILIKFPDGINNESSDDEKAETKKKAEEVLAKVNAGEDFDSLVEQYNEDPGAGKSGYTFANDGTMVQEFSDAAFALEVGKVSGLVETSYGYHIIKRCDRVPTFEEYTKLLNEKTKVKINRPYYTKLTVDVNLKDYIGDTAGGEEK